MMPQSSGGKAVCENMGEKGKCGGSEPFPNSDLMSRNDQENLTKTCLNFCIFLKYTLIKSDGRE